MSQENSQSQNWQLQAWKTIDDLYQRLLLEREQSGNNKEFDAKDFFEKKVGEPGVIQSLPSLNFVPTHELVDGQFVRFRGMVQDSFDTEIFSSEFKVKDVSTGKVTLQTGKYRDFIPLKSGEELDESTGRTVYGDRATYYCTSIPGESPWVEEAFKTESTYKPSGVSLCPKQTNSLKRQLADNPENEAANDDDGDKMVMDPPEEDQDPNKKAKIDNPGTSSNKDFYQPALNQAIQSSRGAKGVIVQLYSNTNVALNECFEFYGIVSLDPALANFPSSEGQENIVMDEFNQKERMARCPSPLIVPRIHVLCLKKLLHNNPNLPKDLESFSVGGDKREMLANCRQELHEILTRALIGDTLASDYLICHLISKIYVRKDMTLGKFSVNLFNVPMVEDYSKELSDLIQLFVTKSHYFPLTVENLNKSTLIPRKDIDANRLISGMLQLPEQFHLMIDETKMANGQLSPEGLKNLTALGTMINWQIVEYGFQFTRVEMKTDAPCLIFSDGRSMLPNDFQVMLQPACTATPEILRENFASIKSKLNEDLMNKLRSYLTLVRHFSLDFNQDVEKAIGEDFVKERQETREQGQTLTVQDMNNLMVLSRLLAFSAGMETVTMDIWQRAKDMEKQRKARVAHLPPQVRQSLMPSNS